MLTHNDSAAIASCVVFIAMLRELLRRDTVPAPEWSLEAMVIGNSNGTTPTKSAARKFARAIRDRYGACATRICGRYVIPVNETRATTAPTPSWVRQWGRSMVAAR